MTALGLTDLRGRCRLTGLGYFPLRDESTFSSLMRLGWLNIFNRREIADYCIGPEMAVPNFANFTPPKWLRSEQALRSLGWTLPNNLEQRIHKQFASEYYVAWNFHRLKFCPLCMEGLYHAVWFQLRRLQRCPVHDCQLVEICMSCGAQSPSYSFDSSVFNTPYLCSNCCNPFSGAPPSIDAHEVIRETSSLFENAFVDYRAWLERVDLKRYYRLWPERDGNGWSGWCDVGSIKEHYFNYVSEMPSEIAPISRSDLVVLGWRTRMFDDDESDYRGSSIYDNGDEMIRVLQVFLRYMKPWVFEGISEDKQQSIRDQYHESASINPQNFDVRQLTYLIVEHSHNWYFGPRKGQLGRMCSWRNRIPKVAYCAYLYGIYSGIYHSLHKLRRCGATTWLPTNWFCIDDYLIAICTVSSDGVHSGRIVFPEVTGMPMLLRFCRIEPADS